MLFFHKYFSSISFVSSPLIFQFATLSRSKILNLLSLFKLGHCSSNLFGCWLWRSREIFTLEKLSALREGWRDRDAVLWLMSCHHAYWPIKNRSSIGLSSTIRVFTLSPRASVPLLAAEIAICVWSPYKWTRLLRGVRGIKQPLFGEVFQYLCER